jgi:hypothetical protein
MLGNIQQSKRPGLQPTQQPESRGVRTPAGRDRWDANHVSRLLAA